MVTNSIIALTFILLLFTFSSFSQKVSNSAFDIAKAKKELEAVNKKISEYFDKEDANAVKFVLPLQMSF